MAPQRMLRSDKTRPLPATAAWRVVCVREGKPPAARIRGFTLIELMVVLVILAMLTTIAAPRVTKYLRTAKTQTAKIQVDALASAVDAYFVDVGQFPGSSDGLKALLAAPSGAKSWDGPYVKKADSLLDPWGHAYLYRVPGTHDEFDVYTLGADGKAGGERDDADIGNW